jgi:proteic killer suppression protein
VIVDVVLSKAVERELPRLPPQVRRKLMLWVMSVERDGLEEVRRIPGFHDEPLKGQRQGQRSIRLNKAYRAIYEIHHDGRVEFVQIEEVHKHAY